MAKIIGIDLGTTFSAVAVMEAGAPKILENAEGARTTPSIVAISKTGERLVGLLAKRQAVTNPKNTIFGIKRFIGHTFADPAVQKDKGTVPFEIKSAPNGGVLVKMGDKDFRPEEVSAMILQKLKADAEARLGEKVTEAIITVPAYFNDSQARRPRTPVRLPALRSSASSTNRPPPRWRTALTKRRTRKSPSSTSVAVLSISPFSKWVMMWWR